MKNYSIKQNPFLAEVDEQLNALGLDVEKVKQVVPNAVLFNFKYNDVPVYVCVPATLPCPYSSIARIEAGVAILPEVEAAHLVVSIASYLQIEDSTPVRIATKKSKGTNIHVLIEFVCDLHILQEGAFAEMLRHCCELADHLQNELVEQRISVAA